MGQFRGPCPTRRVLRVLRLIRTVYINANSTMISRAVFDDVGLYDESEATALDLDMFFRIIERYDIVRVPEPLLLYRLHPGQITRRPFTGDPVVARALRRLGGIAGVAGVALHLTLKAVRLPMYARKRSQPGKRPLWTLVSAFPAFLRLVLETPH